jgi:hypothetical protein
MGGASLYMKDLSEKLAFIRSDVLAPINTGDTNRERYAHIHFGVMQRLIAHTFQSYCHSSLYRAGIPFPYLYHQATGGKRQVAVDERYD